MAPLYLALTNAGINQGALPDQKSGGRAVAGAVEHVSLKSARLISSSPRQRVDGAIDPSSFRGRANGSGRNGRPDDTLREEPGIHNHDP